MAAESLSSRVIKELLGIFSILEERLADPNQFVQFMRELGWNFPVNLVPDFREFNTKIEAVSTLNAELEAAEGDADRTIAGAQLVAALLELVDELKGIGAR